MLSIVSQFIKSKQIQYSTVYVSNALTMDVHICHLIIHYFDVIIMKKQII